MAGIVIQRNDEGLPSYYSLKVGRDYAAGVGGWSQDQKLALQFARVSDAATFANAYLKELAPFCVFNPVQENP